MAGSNSRVAQAIIRSAIELFKKDGYENVSVNDICKAAGASRSSFYLLFSGKKDIIGFVMNDVRKNQEGVLADFMAAENDVERMWCLCERFLTIFHSFGPELTGALLQLELCEPIGMVDAIHSVDDWAIKLMGSAQKSGHIRSTVAPEVLVPMVTDLLTQTIYSWCREHGGFSLRARSRLCAEILFDVAPELRWSSEQMAEQS